MGVAPKVYIPESTKFLMYFENDVVQVDLDASYLNDPETATGHAAELLKAARIEPDFFRPKNYTASTLPDVPTNFEFMCCPRSVSDLSSKIGLGYIGPRVRRIIQAARFPVLITSPVFKPWKRIAVFFGGSANAVNALRLGIRIAKITGMALEIYTQAGRKKEDSYRAVVRERGLEETLNSVLDRWRFFHKGRLENNLYEVPHDALVVMGAYGPRRHPGYHVRQHDGENPVHHLQQPAHRRSQIHRHRLKTIVFGITPKTTNLPQPKQPPGGLLF